MVNMPPCGLYYIVTDSIGKPVLTMDANRRVSGVADYDPFGHVNRTTLVADTPLGVAPQQTALMATLQVPTSAATGRLRSQSLPDGTA